MNFFTQLASLGQGMDIALRIKGKNGKITVAVEPQMANVSRLKPLVLTGTPEEMDEGFFAQFDGAMTAARGLESNLAEVKKDATELATGSKDKKGGQEKPAHSSAKKKPEPASKKTKEQPAKKPAKEEKAGPVVGDMFNQPSPEPTPAAVEDEVELEGGVRDSAAGGVSLTDSEQQQDSE